MKTIGLFLGTTEDSYGKEVVRGVAQALKGTGHRLVCITSGTIHSRHGYEAQRNVLYDLVDARSVDALIVSGSLSHNVTHEELLEFCHRYRPIPLVTMSVALSEVPAVITDNAAGMHGVMDHLLGDHKYQRLAFLGGPPGQQEAEVRRSVFLDRLQQAQLPVTNAWMLDGDYTRHSGQEAGRKLVRWLSHYPEGPWPQVIVSANDSMALGAQEALISAGFCFPEDFSITGFDDMSESRVSKPPMTTVRQSSSHLAEEAGRLVLRLLAGEKVPLETRVPPTLMVRGSCGCRKGDVRGRTKEENLLPGRVGPEWKSRLDQAFAQAQSPGQGAAFANAIAELMAEQSTEEAEPFARALLERLAVSAPVSTRSMLLEARTVVVEASLRTEALERSQTVELLDRLRGTTEDMLTSESFPQLLEVLQSTLRHIGFSGFWLSLFENPAQPATQSRLHVARAPTGHATVSVEGQSFPSRDLIPGGLGSIDSSETLLVVEALYSRNARLGFVLFASDLTGTQITGTLRGQLSGALQAVLLLEERKQAELQLIQSEKMAALGALVAGVAHEINTPLGVSITASSFLAVQTKEFVKKFHHGKMTKSELETYLGDAQQVSDSVQANLARAADLISSFKQVSADQASEQRRTFALKEYLQEALLSLHFQWKNRPVEVSLEGPGGQILDSYPGALVQILTNLLSNSLLHAWAPGEPGRITLGVENRGNSVLLWFADDGVGIPLENQSHIFEPFFTTKRGRGGTGLGLNIVFNLVNNVLGGIIACVSKPGEGTRFNILLPRKPPA